MIRTNSFDLWKYNNSKNYGYYKGEEIPHEISFKEYYDYIRKNIKINADKKKESEWTDLDYKEVHSRQLRLVAARTIRDKYVYDEPLSERELKNIECIRNGTDFDVSNEQLAKLFE